MQSSDLLSAVIYNAQRRKIFGSLRSWPTALSSLINSGRWQFNGAVCVVLFGHGSHSRKRFCWNYCLYGVMFAQHWILRKVTLHQQVCLIQVLRFKSFSSHFYQWQHYCSCSGDYTSCMWDSVLTILSSGDLYLSVYVCLSFWSNMLLKDVTLESKELHELSV